MIVIVDNLIGSHDDPCHVDYETRRTQVKLDVQRYYTVSNVKSLLFEQQSGWEPSLQRLLYDCVVLEDERVLSDYSTANNAVLHLYMLKEPATGASMDTKSV